MIALRKERGRVVQVVDGFFNVCVCQVSLAVDESHFTAPITGLCSANAV